MSDEEKQRLGLWQDLMCVMHGAVAVVFVSQVLISLLLDSGGF